jgi:predicted transcriptional regulator
MSNEVFEYVKNNGGKVSIEELANATGRKVRSVGANVTDLTKKGLAVRVKEKGEDDKEITYVQLTDEGYAFVPSED